MADPLLDEILSVLSTPSKLRLALNTLEWEMPVAWGTGAVGEALRALRASLEELELAEIRTLGPRAYLMIRPLAPDTGAELAETIAGHVRALDDLGMLVRLD
jgi:hypothetical protein